MTTSLAKRLASEPVSKIEISIRCTALLDKDIGSLSDPCCVVQLMTAGNIWTELGRTERIKNNLNPVFAKVFQIDYFFEEVQRVRFLVYDIDNTTQTLDDDDFLGSMECTLGEIVSNSPYTKPLLLKGSRVAGKSTITIRAQEVAQNNEILLLQFCAKNLDNKDFFGKSDPYLELHRKLRDGGYQLVHRTEVVKNDLNPRWRAFEVKTSRLCGGNKKELVKIDCYDYDDDGSHDFIGSFETCVEEMLNASSKVVQWPCINPKKKAKKKNYTNSGIVILNSCTITKEFSFLDFVFGGLQINFTVGIDFTASNGNPTQPQSLHYMDMYQPNHYLKAIQSVGQILQDYDSDQMFPALGYGAKIPPRMEVSHCFPLTFNSSNPFCAGIQGIMDAYRICLSQVQLYGPTNFSPIIYHVAQFAETAHRERKAKDYYILLIITDGEISDMKDTIRAIIFASTLPLSIIIVGVGNADFQAMDTLDADNGALTDGAGNYAKRDIVQFVPLRNFVSATPAALAKQVLAEVPEQVVGYYKMNNIQPEKPKPADAVTKPVEGLNQIPPSSSSVYPSQQIPPAQPGPVPPGRPNHAPGQPAQYPPGQYPPGQPGQYPPGQPGQHPPGQPGQYPPGQPGQYPSGQPGQYPSGQPGQYHPGQPSQHPPGQPGQYPPGQPGQYPSGQPGQYPSGQPGQYPPGQPGQYPPGQPGQYPPGAYQPVRPGQYPSPQHGQQPYPGQPSTVGFGQIPSGVQAMLDYMNLPQTTQQPGQVYSPQAPYPQAYPNQYQSQAGYPPGQPGHQNHPPASAPPQGTYQPGYPQQGLPIQAPPVQQKPISK